MTLYLLSIDPGKSTGVAVFEYSGTAPADLVFAYQWNESLFDTVSKIKELYDRLSNSGQGVEVICEKFTPRPNGAFNHTLQSVEPLRVEGWLVASGFMSEYAQDEHRWRQPQQQYIAQTGSKAQKKRKNREFQLKTGLWKTGKDVGQPDADDANSAIMHGILHLRDTKHTPTLKEYFAPNIP